MDDKSRDHAMYFAREITETAEASSADAKMFPGVVLKLFMKSLCFDDADALLDGS